MKYYTINVAFAICVLCLPFLCACENTRESLGNVGDEKVRKELAAALNNLAVSASIIRETADYAAVERLVVAERLYRVSHRNEDLAKCYAEDAQIHTSWQKGGVSSFVGKSPREAVARPNVNRNNPPLVHLNGDRAFVEYPSTTTRSVDVKGKEAVLTSYMRLLYRAEKRSGEWKITAMTSLNEWDELAPAIPGETLDVRPAELDGLRASYRFLAYTRKLAGGEVNMDELGVDRPEDVNKFYAREMEWLNGKLTSPMPESP